MPLTNFLNSIARYFVPAALAACLAGFASKTIANVTEKPLEKTRIDFVSTAHKGSELQLEARQAPLAQVLENIATKTHVPIHYSVLPEGLVSATCVGSTLKVVLECLLDGKADLIVRYSDRDTHAAGNVVETWVLGSRLDGVVAKNCPMPAAPNDTDSNAFDENQAQIEVEQLRTQELLKLAQSKNPEERADAIGAFLSEGGEGDPEIKAVLEQALTDTDDNVRAQAVSTLSHREGGASTEAVIREAMRDSSPAVRMMAVDSITNDVALLQQAVNDSDETIRNLAALKLEQLTPQ